MSQPSEPTESPGAGATPDETGPVELTAAWAADPTRLMTGEDPQSRRLSDALHWVRVYDELITFKDELMDLARTRMAEMASSAAEEIRHSDLVLLAAERTRFAARREFWRDRRRLLEAEETTDS